MAEKLTFEEVKSFINNETEYILKQDYYINDRAKLKLSCKKCNKIYYRTWESIKASNRMESFDKCKKCRDYEELYNRIHDYFREFGEGCILVEKDYKDLKKDRLEIICHVCGERFDCYYNSFKAKQRKICKPCSDKIRSEESRFTIEQVRDIVESVNGNKLLSEVYLGSKELLNILCSCGVEYNTTLTNFNKGKNTCDICSNRGTQWNKDLVKEYIISQGSEFIKQEYVNVDTLMKFKCQKCKEEYETSFYNFHKNKKYICNSCAFEIIGEKQSFSYKEVYDMIEETGCHLITDYYINNTQELEIQCGTCGESFYNSWGKFRIKNNKACSNCNGKISAGERIFKDLLEQNKIEYIHQHTYPDCRYKQVLQFDFYLSKFNSIIEIDGRQHREVIEAFGGIEEFELVKLRDEIKNTYCKDNNIPLIRIEYNDSRENIEIFIKRCKDVLLNFMD